MIKPEKNLTATTCRIVATITTPETMAIQTIRLSSPKMKSFNSYAREKMFCSIQNLTFFSFIIEKLDIENVYNTGNEAAGGKNIDLTMLRWPTNYRKL